MQMLTTELIALNAISDPTEIDPKLNYLEELNDKFE